MSDMRGRDPTRPQAPAFTKNLAHVDIMERQAARKRKGGLLAPMLYARMEAQMKKGPRRGNAA